MPVRPLSHLVRALAYETAVVLVTAVSVACLAYVGLQGRFSDLYLRARGPAAGSGEVALVPIGDEALYLWAPGQPAPERTPRDLLARLVGLLDEAGARVVVLDLLLDQPAAGDAALAAAAEAHGAVLCAERWVEGGAGLAPFAAGPAPSLGPALQGAPANLQLEEGQLWSGELLVRQVPLVRRVSRARLAEPWPLGMLAGVQAEDAPTPGLAFAAAWLHRARGASPGARLADLDRELARGCGPGRAGRLRCTVSATNLGLPATPRPLHAPMTLNYRGPEGAGGLAVVPAARLLRVAAEAALATSLGAPRPVELPAEVRAALADKVVLVGRVDEAAAGDRFVTPWSFPLLMRADMAGLELQAQAVDALLAGAHVRPVGRPWTWALAALLTAGIVATRRRLPGALHAGAWLGGMAGLIALCAAVYAWTDGLCVELDLPLAAALGTLLAVHLRDHLLHDLGDPGAAP